MDAVADFKVRLIEPAVDTLVAAMYDEPDYRDAFLIPGNWHNVEEFTTAFFTGQPRLLARLSMNSSPAVIRAAVGDQSYAEGSSVGSWRVHGRSDREIVFGDDMGFMEYRFSFRLRDDEQIEASTAVKYKSARMGPIYFSIVKPFHRRFVAIALRNAAKTAQSSH